MRADTYNAKPQTRASGSLATRVRRFHLAGLLPAPVVVTIFLVIPLLLVIAYSVMEANGYGGVRVKFSPEAYIQLLFDRQLDDSLVFTNAYMIIAWRSVVIALLTTLVTALIGFPVAVYIALQPASRRNLLILLVTIPFWTNVLVRTYSWILMLRDTGVINGTLLKMSVIHQPLALLYTDAAVLIGLVYAFAPFMVLPIYASLEKMDVRLLEAAHDLYASKLQTLRNVVMPAAKHGIIAGCMLTFIPCLGAMIAPELLGGGKKMMLGNLIYRQFTEARNWPFGSVLAVTLLAAIVLFAIMVKLMKANNDQLLSRKA